MNPKNLPKQRKKSAFDDLMREVVKVKPVSKIQKKRIKK